MEKFLCRKCLKILTKSYVENNKACECGCETHMDIIEIKKELKELREYREWN